MASIALWRGVQKVAMVMDSAKPIMHWNGNVGANLDGLGQDVICLLKLIVLTAETMTKVGKCFKIHLDIRKGVKGSRILESAKMQSSFPCCSPTFLWPLSKKRTNFCWKSYIN